MDDDGLFPTEAPLQAYLDLAQHYYLEDRLDAAMQVVTDAFQAAGWPAGSWTAFFNELQCEKDARDASEIHKVDGLLSVELDRLAPEPVLRALKSSAAEARRSVGELLRVELRRPVLVTVFMPDAPVDFIFGSHGYVSHKIGLDKICIPHDTLEPPEELEDALVHEFSHVAAHELAGEELPVWLDEGLATYLCGELSDRHVRFVVSTAARSRQMLNLERLAGLLVSPDERKDNPSRVSAAYFVTGSFVEFWVERHGIESVRDALVRIGKGQRPDRAVHKATGTPLREIEREWRRGLTGSDD